MAGLPFTASASKAVAVADGQRCILAMQAPTNQRVQIPRIDLNANGGAQADKPTRVEIHICSDDGTLDTLTPVMNGAGSETIQTACWQHKVSGHVNPTKVSLVRTMKMLPFGGQVSWVPIEKDGFELKGGQIIGVFVTADSAA